MERGFACLSEVEEPSDGDGYEVACWTVDDLCCDCGIEHVRYLMPDVEGAELLALEGSAGMLAAHEIDFVLVETDFAMPVTADIDRLSGHGYRPCKTDASGVLHPVEISAQRGRFEVIWTAQMAAPRKHGA